MAERDTGLLAPFTISDKAKDFARALRIKEDTNYDDSDNKYDAIRHIGGVLALYAQYPKTASDIVTGGKEYLDEYLLGGTEEAGEMDKHNNEIGRKLFQMLPKNRAESLTTEEALQIAKEYVEGWEDAPEGKNPMDLPDSMRPKIIYGKTKEPEMSEDEGPLYRKGADGTWEMKEQPTEMAAGGLMFAPGGGVLGTAVKAGAKALKSDKAKKYGAPTAVALGTITSSEEAEAAYIPLEAFEQGTEAAINLFKRVKKLIDEGVEGEELYQKTGAFKDPDGRMKVDVAELKARDVEMAMAVGKFTEDAMKFLGSTAKSKKPLERTMGDYLPANSPVFENFPELANAKVIMRKGGGGLYGKYSPGKKEITVYVPTQADGSMYADPQIAMDRAIKAFNTLVHEFQHHIQDVKKAREVGYNTAGPMTSNVKKMQDDFKDLTTYLETDLSTPSLPFTRSEAEARLNQIKDFLMSQGITQKEFTENTASSIAGRVGYGIYVRELGEAEARSSGRKAFLTEADPTRKQVGVFYPATSEDPGTLEAVKMGSEQALAPEQILVRAHSYGSGPSAGDPLKFVNPETAKKSGAKTGAASAAALTGLAAATPSQAFVEGLGFEDPTPTKFLIGDERLKDLPLEQQVLLDQVFVPKTKPYDILSGSPLGLGMMAADVIDMGFGDFLRGEGTEAGQRIRAEAKKKEEEQQDDSVEEMQAGGFVGDVYNQPYQPPQNLPPKNTDPSDDEMMQLNLRQGGGVETEAGVEMEQEGKKKFELDRKKADLNNDGELSAYEKARGEAIQKNMAEMNMGGMMSDPFAPLQVVIGIDGQSGNHIPAGSKAEEVRDDIPAMLSEGEYVMPADVVRWHGLKKMEELRCEAKNALGLMAKHDRIAMVDDDTKEPIEKEDIEYEIEEKDKPEVEEAEVKVVEAQTGADIQTTDPEGVEPLPPITYYRYETRWDPASNRYKRVPVDPITGETVTAETFERERASRYGLPQVFGEPKVRCPEGYEYDEEKQICMPIKSEQEQVAAAAQTDTGDDGGAGAFTQGLATEPTGPTSLRDYTSYQAAEFLGPDRDLVTPEQALERMTTPTDVELPTGLSALSLPAQIMSRVGRFADAVGAQRAALQREDLIQASAQDIAEGKIDVGRLPTTYDFTFNPDTASFEKSRPSRITEITDVGGKPIVTGFDYVGSSGQTYTSEEVFEDDTKFEDVFGKGFERGTPSTGSFVQDTTALGVRSPDYIPSSEAQRKGSNARLQEPMPFGVPREMVDTTYTGMGAIDLPAYTPPTTTPSFADVYDLGPIDTLGIMAPEPTTTVEPTVTEPTGPLTNREGDVVTTSTVTDKSGTTTTVTTTTDTDTGRSSSFLDSDKDGVKDSSERGVVTSRDGSPVTSGSGSVVTSRSEDQISGRDDNDDDGGGYDGPGSDPSDDGPSDSFGGDRGSDGWGE